MKAEKTCKKLLRLPVLKIVLITVGWFLLSTTVDNNKSVIRHSQNTEILGFKSLQV